MLPLNGKPLVHWTIAMAVRARASGIVDTVAVSSDWTELANYVTRQWESVDMIHRPSHLADEKSTSHDAQAHALQVYRDAHGYRPDVVVMLQPTSPLRTVQDVDAALDLMARRGADAVVSVTDTEESAFELGHASRLRPISPIGSHHGFVVPNGAIYIIKTEALERGETWWTALTYAYRMPKDRSIDIDTAEDFQLAERTMEGLAA